MRRIFWSIKKFACDYRDTDEEWKLPYIRIGNSHSNAAVNIGSGILNNKYAPKLSELDQIWWVWKHLSEFGNPDFVGFCHYRRFFSVLVKESLANVNKDEFDPNFALTPEEELMMILASKAAGCSMIPRVTVDMDDTPVWTRTAELHPEMTPEVSQKLFEMFIDKAPDRLKDPLNASLTEKSMYLCNIFTLKTELFDELSRILFPTLLEFEESLDDSFRKRQHPRYLGFYAERLISCYLHAIQMLNYKILHFPLMTIDGFRHNALRQNDDGFLEEVFEDFKNNRDSEK